MAFAVRGASLLRAPAGAARLTAPRRAAALPRRALRARAALPSPTQVDGLIGIALCRCISISGGVGSIASSLAAAASVRSVPVALSVLVGGVLTLERDAIAAKLASPGIGGVIRGLAALVAAAVSVGFIYATQAPLATLAIKAVDPMLQPSVPLALSALAFALVSLEGGELLKKHGATVARVLPDLVAGALVALVVVNAIGPATAIAHHVAASLAPPPPPPPLPVCEVELAHAGLELAAGAHAHATAVPASA